MLHISFHRKSSGAKRVGSTTGPTFLSRIILQPLLETENIALSIRSIIHFHIITLFVRSCRHMQHLMDIRLKYHRALSVRCPRCLRHLKSNAIISVVCYNTTICYIAFCNCPSVCGRGTECVCA